MAYNEVRLRLPESTTKGQVEFEAIGINMRFSGDTRKHIKGVSEVTFRNVSIYSDKN